MSASNNRVPKHMRHKLMELEGEIDESTIIVGDFGNSLSEMGRSNRQKINTDMVELNSTIINWI